MDPLTKIKVRLGTVVNLGNYENISLELEVEDYVRDGVDKNSDAAIDRVYSLVEKKLAEKLEPFKGD